MDTEEVWSDFVSSIFAKKYPNEIQNIKYIYELISKSEEDLTDVDCLSINSDPNLLEAWIYCKDNPSMAILHAVRLAYGEMLLKKQESNGGNDSQFNSSVQDTFKIYGLLGGEIGDKNNRQSEHQKVMEIITYLSPQLLKILELAGKIKFSGMRSKIKTKGPGRHKLKGVTVSNKIEDMHISELRLLDDPLTEILVLKNYADNQLRINEYEGEETLSQGPVILVEDISMSMEGASEEWAKALGIAVARSVASQKRPVYYIQFAGEATKAVKIETSSIKHICNVILNNQNIKGGTVFDPPIKESLRVLKKDKRCDIIFITDGMGDALQDKTLDELESINDLQIIGVRIFNEETDNFYIESSKEFLSEFCTSLHEVRDLSIDKAVQIFNKI